MQSYQAHLVVDWLAMGAAGTMRADSSRAGTSIGMNSFDAEAVRKAPQDSGGNAAQA